MRNIYTDEAGTSPSPHEPYRIVIALIVHPDTQWFPALRHLGGLFQNSVPAQYRKGFEFHAKDLYAKGKYPNWDYEERKKLMRTVMAIPGEFNIPVALAAVPKNGVDWNLWPNKKMSPTEVDHYMAFCTCMCVADYYIRNHCGIELAQVIADRNASMRQHMQRGLDMARLRPITEGQAAADIGELRVERIIDEIHFTDGFRAPFLQIADACAFAYRRAFSKQPDGSDFVKVVAGDAYQAIHGEPNNGFHLQLILKTDEEGQPWKPSDWGLIS